MARVYFFKHDGLCKFMKLEVANNYPAYVQDGGRSGEIPYYAVTAWNTTVKGHIVDIFEMNNYRYIDRLEDLPEGAGIYIGAYDGVVEEIEALREKNIPLIDRPCPWLAKMKKNLKQDLGEYQYVLLLREGHIVYNNYKSVFPPGTIFVEIENYEMILKKNTISKPVYFMPYATMRRSDAVKVAEYIGKEYPHDRNIFNMETLCGWVTKQGVIEEIQQVVKEKRLDEIWIISNSASDTSTRSLVREVEENGAKPVIIKKIEDIPQDTGADLRIGCLIAPVPFYYAIAIKLSIRRQYGNILE